MDLKRPADIKLKVDKPLMVVPIEPTPQQSMFLSNIDQVVLYPIETVYYFPAKVGMHSTVDVVDKLRQALERVLVPYYFMAGRLKVNMEEERLELDCNGKGVLFAGARSEMTLDELGDIMAANPALNDLVLRVDGVMTLEDLPVTTMQVTRFRCGGFALGFSSNHTLLDGVAAGDFLNNFASLVRGEGLVVSPKPERRALEARRPPEVRFRHIEYVWPPARISETPPPDPNANPEWRALVKRRKEIEALSAATSHGHPLDTVTYKRFVVTSQMLARLKQIAQSELHRPCTTFEVLAAHFWQCKSAAAAAAGDDDDLSSLLFAVDFRKLVIPPLPEGFAGNAVLSACAQAPTCELLQKGLGFAVEKVQEAKARVTDEYVRSAVDCLEVHKGRIPVGPGIYVSAWWKIPFHTIDFGWGTPSEAHPTLTDMTEFVLFTTDTTSTSHCASLNVLLSFPPSQLPAFHQLFLAPFTHP